MLEVAPTPLQDVFSNRFAVLEDWEKSMIVAALQRVATMMNAEEIDASPVLYVGGAMDQPAGRDVIQAVDAQVNQAESGTAE